MTWTADLGPDYRIVDAGDHWDLENRCQFDDPCPQGWHTVETHPTAVACLQAYLELQAAGELP